MPAKRDLVFILLLVAIALSAYCNCPGNSFVYDDYPVLVDNPSVRKLDLRSLVSYFTDMNSTSSNAEFSKGIWRPLATASFAVDYKIWKLDPRPYHAENVILHIINAILLYIATVLILESSFAAFIASLIFAIHPVQTESVVWVAGRSNVLFMLFFLASFILHIRNRKYGPSGSRYCWAVIFFTLGLLSREMAIVTPLVFIAYDLHFHPQKDMKRYINYYFPFFLVTAFYLLARISVLGAVSQQVAWWGENIFYNILAMFKVIAGYVRLLILPLNLRVTYVVNIPKFILEPYVLAALLAVSIMGLAWFLFRRKKEVSFYFAWFFITLLPVYGLVPTQLMMAERFLYLPLVAFASLFAIALSQLASGSVGRILKYASVLAAISIFVMYWAVTVSRNSEWRDEVSLYESDAMRSPESDRCHYNLAFAYAKKGSQCYEPAISELNKALSLNPNLGAAYLELGNIYNNLEQYDLAVINFKKSIAIERTYSAYNNLSISYLCKGMYGDAIECCKKAIELKPDHPYSYVNLGNAYFLNNEDAKADHAWAGALKFGYDASRLKQGIKELQKRRR